MMFSGLQGSGVGVGVGGSGVGSDSVRVSSEHELADSAKRAAMMKNFFM